MNTLAPKIYVACLAAYNAGILFGKWIDADQSPDALQDEISNLLSTSPIPSAEEWAIHDVEDFGSLEVSEHEALTEISEKATFIAEHGHLGAELLNHFGDVENAQEALDNYYHGHYESDLEFATQLFDECYAHNIPDNLHSYIDYEAFCKDLFICDYFSLNTHDGVYVFSCH